jgi:GTP-binding protein
VHVEFVTSTPDLAGRPAEILPEFAFVGRSNCGKSSLINYYLGRKRLAHTSGQPGKTRLMNYYRVEGRYYLVDLPGYGYARVSKRQRASWLQVFRAYLAVQDRPLAVFHLLDIRHEPTAADRQVSDWIVASGHPHGAVATKIDKVGTSSRLRHYQQIIGALDLPSSTPFFPTSAIKAKGRKEIQAWIDALLLQADG